MPKIPSTTNTPATNMFFFRLEKWEEVKQSLSALSQEKERLLALGNPSMIKLFDYLTPLAESVNAYKQENIFDSIDMSTVSFLSPVLIKSFIQSPANENLLKLLTSQVLLVSAATKTIAKQSFQPYDADELEYALLGDERIYNEVLYLYTLRDIVGNVSADVRAVLLLNSLPPADTDALDFDICTWPEALIQSMFLQAVWKNFIFFTDKQQEFLLKNYLYSSIVAGVPVKFWIRQVLGAGIEGVNYEVLNRVMLKFLEDSAEVIPQNSINLEQININDILEEYVSQVYGEGIKALAQEKFIKEFYDKEPEGKKFSNWLRDYLQIYSALHSKEWLIKF